MPTTKPTSYNGPDSDEALDAEAQGVASDDDDDESAETETDAIGKAAGVRAPRHKPLRGDDEVADRDAHRWELDPASAEDAASRR